MLEMFVLLALAVVFIPMAVAIVVCAVCVVVLEIGEKLRGR